MKKPITIVIIHRPDRELKTFTGNQTFDKFDEILITDYNFKGQCWARNQGFKKAKTDYVLFLDDDLLLEPEMVEKMYFALKDTEHSFSYCNYKTTGKINSKFKMRPWDFKELKKYNYISTCSMVKRKDFCGWDEKFHRLVDWDVWLTMGEQGKSGIWVDEFLFTAFFDNDSISVQPDYHKWEKLIKEKHNL